MAENIIQSLSVSDYDVLRFAKQYSNFIMISTSISRTYLKEGNWVVNKSASDKIPQKTAVL